MVAAELAALLMQHPHSEVFVLQDDCRGACPVMAHVECAEHDRKVVVILHTSTADWLNYTELEKEDVV